MSKLSIFILISFSLVFPLLAPAQKDAQPRPDRTPVYKQVGDVELKMHIFNPTDLKPGDKRPVIVFFFGGGWVGGSPGQFYPHCRYFASRGMVAMAAEYRVAKQHKTSPRECVKDGKSAIRWIRTEANALGIDPDRLAAGGGSAGGHVAAATATLKAFDEEGEDINVSCRPNALVLFNPVYDNGPDGWGHGKVKDYWKDISPRHNLSRDTPPTIVFLGTRDKLIPVATARAYEAAMKKIGGRCDLHLYEGAGHGFFNYGRGDYYKLTVAEADKFLVSLGFLKGKPTL